LRNWQICHNLLDWSFAIRPFAWIRLKASELILFRGRMS